MSDYSNITVPGNPVETNKISRPLIIMVSNFQNCTKEEDPTQPLVWHPQLFLSGFIKITSTFEAVVKAPQNPITIDKAHGQDINYNYFKLTNQREWLGYLPRDAAAD